MRLLLVGENREGALLRSLEIGLRSFYDVTVTDPGYAVTALADRTSTLTSIRRRLRGRHTTACFLEAVEQLRPDVTLIIKGRGITAQAIQQSRSFTRIALYYPDNPFWLRAHGEALASLAAADIAVVWSERIRDLVRPLCNRAEFVPFGYDKRWFPITDPRADRKGVVFVGTWSLRRERHLLALSDLPLSVVGSGWSGTSGLAVSPPAYGIHAGSLLQQAAIAVNVFHPHNSDAHNMRTREIAASGALQISDPGTDGTPLRDGDGCRWFRSPAHLRELVEHYLEHRDEGVHIAVRAQELVRHEDYGYRASEFSQLFQNLA